METQFALLPVVVDDFDGLLGTHPCAQPRLVFHCGIDINCLAYKNTVAVIIEVIDLISIVITATVAAAKVCIDFNFHELYPVKFGVIGLRQGDRRVVHLKLPQEPPAPDPQTDPLPATVLFVG
jgi:hypothetical protein